MSEPWYMDFYCRQARALHPTCECYMMSLAWKLHYLEATFPGWAHSERTYWSDERNLDGE